MECVVDIQHYNVMIQEDRGYVFLDGLDDRLDKIQGDILYRCICSQPLSRRMLMSVDRLSGKLS